MERPDPVVHILLCHSPDMQGARTGANGFSERTLAEDVNFFVAERLRAKKVACWPVQKPTLIQRIMYLKKMSQLSPHQVALEVHFNSAPNETARGFMTLAHADSVHGLRLAKCIHERIHELRPTAPDLGVCACRGDLRYVDSDRQYRLQRLALLEDVKQWCCIPEAAFLSNKDDQKWVMKFDNRKALGYSISQGTIDFLETLTLEV